jgi:oxygen-independent coproporphyrinogen-3 oxidase
VAAAHCVENARRAGFANISVDLIYAIPGQDNEAWTENIKKALALDPEHISCYTLTVEAKTAFGRWAAQGKLKMVDDEIAADQLEILVYELEKAGYEHYEVSNFSKPGYYSNHNSNYWKREPYLGVGPSAHSYNGVSRQYNVANNALYLRALKQRKIPFELEVLTRENQINEYLLTTLRTTWGCNLAILQNDFDYAVSKTHATYLEELQTKNLAILEDSVLKLTKTGKLLADKIASDLFC